MGMEKKIDFNIIDTEISDELGQYLKSGVGVPELIKVPFSSWEHF